MFVLHYSGDQGRAAKPADHRDPDTGRRVIDAGFKEIAITGVHLGSYGRDLTPSSSLVELLRALGREAAASSEPFVRFRISSLEPMDCSREVVDLVADCDVVRASFPPAAAARQRPVAGGDAKAVHRRERTRRSSNDIRARMPSASIGSDIIVGFPGEHDEDFEELCGYLAQSPLTHLHVFPYSDRPGTVASSMSGKVPGGVIRARAARVRDIGHRLTSAFRRGAARDHPSRPHDRRRNGRRHRQLSEGTNSARLRPQRMGEGEDHRGRRIDGGGNRTAWGSAVVCRSGF